MRAGAGGKAGGFFQVADKKMDQPGDALLYDLLPLVGGGLWREE
jgi:hypothetical protein